MTSSTGAVKSTPSRTLTDPGRAPNSEPVRASASSSRRTARATASVLLPPVSLAAAVSTSATTSGRLIVITFAMWLTAANYAGNYNSMADDVNASAEPRQQADEAAGARAEQGGSIEIAGGALAGLAAGRVGDDQIGHRGDLQLARNRQGPRQDQVAGPRAEDRRAENAAVRAGDDLYFARRVALGLGAVVVGERVAQHPDRPRFARRRLRQPDLRQFGIGIGDPGQ